MAITYFPFDSGAGANVTEDQWRKMARFWLRTGVLDGEDNELAVSESSPAAMSVNVATGKAWVRGHYMESTAVETRAIGTAHATLARIDRVVVRVDFGANTITLAVLEGTPAGSPTAPALTQTSSIWEIALAQVSVPAADTVITNSQITDERIFVGSEATFLVVAGADLTSANTIVPTHEYHRVTGSVMINNIAYASPTPGQQLRLWIVGGLEIRHADGGGNIRTMTGANVLVAANEIRTLTYDGTYWRLDATPPQARAYHTLHQSIAASTVTELTFDSERFDTDGIHGSDGRLTAKTPGYYLFGATLQWAPNATGSFRQAQIRLNGSPGAHVKNDIAPASNYNPTHVLCSAIYLALNDYLTVHVQHDATSSINLENQQNWSPEFWMVRVS